MRAIIGRLAKDAVWNGFAGRKALTGVSHPRCDTTRSPGVVKSAAWHLTYQNSSGIIALVEKSQVTDADRDNAQQPI